MCWSSAIFINCIAIFSLPWSTVDATCPTLRSYMPRMMTCVEREMVADYGDYRCYELGLASKRCTEDSSMLAIDQACDYPEARCVQPRLSDGSVCPKDQPVVYEDQCRSLVWPCADGLERLEYDIYGQVAQQIKQMHGFFI